MSELIEHRPGDPFKVRVSGELCFLTLIDNPCPKADEMVAVQYFHPVSPGQKRRALFRFKELEPVRLEFPVDAPLADCLREASQLYIPIADLLRRAADEIEQLRSENATLQSATFEVCGE